MTCVSTTFSRLSSTLDYQQLLRIWLIDNDIASQYYLLRTRLLLKGKFCRGQILFNVVDVCPLTLCKFSQELHKNTLILSTNQ